MSSSNDLPYIIYYEPKKIVKVYFENQNYKTNDLEAHEPNSIDNSIERKEVDKYLGDDKSSF